MPAQPISQSVIQQQQQAALQQAAQSQVSQSQIGSSALRNLDSTRDLKAKGMSADDTQKQDTKFSEKVMADAGIDVSKYTTEFLERPELAKAIKDNDLALFKDKAEAKYADSSDYTKNLLRENGLGEIVDLNDKIAETKDPAERKALTDKLEKLKTNNEETLAIIKSDVALVKNFEIQQKTALLQDIVDDLNMQYVNNPKDTELQVPEKDLANIKQFREMMGGLQELVKTTVSNIPENVADSPEGKKLHDALKDFTKAIDDSFYPRTEVLDDNGEPKLDKNGKPETKPVQTSDVEKFASIAQALKALSSKLSSSSQAEVKDLANLVKGFGEHAKMPVMEFLEQRHAKAAADETNPQAKSRLALAGGVPAGVIAPGAPGINLAFSREQKMENQEGKGPTITHETKGSVGTRVGFGGDSGPIKFNAAATLGVDRTKQQKFTDSAHLESHLKTHPEKASKNNVFQKIADNFLDPAGKKKQAATEKAKLPISDQQIQEGNDKDKQLSLRKRLKNSVKTLRQNMSQRADALAERQAKANLRVLNTPSQNMSSAGKANALMQLRQNIQNSSPALAQAAQQAGLLEDGDAIKQRPEKALAPPTESSQHAASLKAQLNMIAGPSYAATGASADATGKGTHKSTTEHKEIVSTMLANPEVLNELVNDSALNLGDVQKLRNKFVSKGEQSKDFAVRNEVAKEAKEAIKENLETLTNYKKALNSGDKQAAKDIEAELGTKGKVNTLKALLVKQAALTKIYQDVSADQKLKAPQNAPAEGSPVLRPDWKQNDELRADVPELATARKNIAKGESAIDEAKTLQEAMKTANYGQAFDVKEMKAELEKLEAHKKEMDILNKHIEKDGLEPNDTSATEAKIKTLKEQIAFNESQLPEFKKDLQELKELEQLKEKMDDLNKKLEKDGVKPNDTEVIEKKITALKDKIAIKEASLAQLSASDLDDAQGTLDKYGIDKPEVGTRENMNVARKDVNFETMLEAENKKLLDGVALSDKEMKALSLKAKKTENSVNGSAGFDLKGGGAALRAEVSYTRPINPDQPGSAAQSKTEIKLTGSFNNLFFMRELNSRLLDAIGENVVSSEIELYSTKCVPTSDCAKIE